MEAMLGQGIDRRERWIHQRSSRDNTVKEREGQGTAASGPKSMPCGAVQPSSGAS